MKKKGLIITVALIFLVLAGGLILPMLGSGETETASKASESEAVTEEKLQIGVLQTTSHPSLDQITEGTIQGLAENGYAEGEDVEIEFQNAQGDQNLMNTMAKSLVEGGADLVIGIGTPASQALSNATSDIPVIMGAVSDPVGSGLVDSLENPGGNVTGVMNKAPVEDQLTFLKEILPETQEVGLLYSSGEDNARAEGERAQKAVEALGMNATTYKVSNTNEIQQMVATMADEVDVIYLPTDNTIASAFNTVVSEADRYDIPLIPTVDNMIAQGGLATIGISQTKLGVESGRVAAEVLDGKDPAEYPVYIVKGGDQLINIQKAEDLGITIPQDILDNSKIVEPIAEGEE